MNVVWLTTGPNSYRFYKIIEDSDKFTILFYSIAKDNWIILGHEVTVDDAKTAINKIENTYDPE